MGKYTGKLLVADFDDTLRPTGSDTVSEGNLRAAEKFMAEGGLFTVATGRDPRSFLFIRPLVKINAPAVLSNGAVLFDPETGEDLYEGFLPFSCRRDFSVMLEEFPEMGLEIVRGLDIRVVRSNANVELHLRDIAAELLPAEMNRIMFPWTKAVAIFPGDIREEQPRAHELVAWLGERFPGLYDAAVSGAIVDIAAAGNNKGTGAQKLAELLDIEPQNVICIGDGWNDIPMLQTAGRAFAPENCVPGIRELENVTILGHAADCLTELLKRLDEEEENTCC